MQTERNFMTSEEKSHYNTVTTLNDDRVILAIIDHPISEDGYLKNFIPALRQSLSKHGEIRLAVYFRHHQGWQQGAAFKDIDNFADYAAKIKKVALINASEKEILRQEVRTVKYPHINSQIFSEDEYAQALQWVMEDRF